METVTHSGQETGEWRETAYRHVRPGADGPVALYVHGSGGTHRAWAHQYGPRGPSHPAVALDLSGHGDSGDVSTTPGPATLAAYVEDVAAVAVQTDADVLVGNSLGGAVVLQTLLEGTLDVAGVVLAGTGAKLTVHEDLRELLAGDFERAIEVLHGTDLLFHDADAEVLERSKSQLRATGRAVTERDFLTCHRFDVRDRLDEVTTPALAVTGEHDHLTPPAYHEVFAEKLPDCELRTLDSCAHLAMLERPDAFNDAVAEFLAGL